MSTDRLDEVLDAAYGCLTRYGVRRTTMDDIATTMGVARSAVYQYVRSTSAARTTPSGNSPRGGAPVRQRLQAATVAPRA